MSAQFNNYTVISFNDFETVVENDELLEELADPGLFGIHCFATNKTLLMDSFQVILSLTNNFHDLKRGLYEPSRELLKDYQRFGSDFFAFVIIACCPEFNNVDRLDENFRALKESWPYERYESKYF